MLNENCSRRESVALNLLATDLFKRLIYYLKRCILLNFESLMKINIYVSSTRAFDFRDFTFRVSTSIIR